LIKNRVRIKPVFDFLLLLAFIFLFFYAEELDSWKDTEKAKKFIEIYWYDKKPIKDLHR